MNRETGVGENSTLLEVLEKRSKQQPGKAAFTFHREPPCAYGHLWQRIEEVAGCLLKNGLKPGLRVITAIPNSDRFFFAFYGIQRAGGIAVPLFPGSGAERIEKIAGICSTSVILLSKTYPPAGIDDLIKSTRLHLIWVEDMEDAPSRHAFPIVSPGDTAFIQFTSGSIGDPKGVQLSHSNLITNVNQMVLGMAITSTDTFVSWLPVYHDMGLILMTMVPFFLGLELVLLPTGLNYLKSWLTAIKEHSATFTAAPDFAYRLCLIYVRDPENYDLSSLRVALNAAEPVRSGTVRRFEERFNLQNIILPAYGLAEATVGVCSWKPGNPVKVDDRGFVSVGKPFPGILLRIINRENQPAKTVDIGEIWVKSDANTSGYYCNPEANTGLFDDDGYVDTGDIGYIDGDGDCFIVGRKKNIIIQSGFNIAAQEVEELMDERAQVRRSAAVGIDRGGAVGEQAYIFLEVKLNKNQLNDDSFKENIVIEAVKRFNDVFGMHPGRVYLVKPGTIPMTYNGKIQYLQLKEQYIKGTLKQNGFIIFPNY